MEKSMLPVWVTIRHDLSGAPVQVHFVEKLDNGKMHEISNLIDLDVWLTPAGRAHVLENTQIAFARANKHGNSGTPFPGRFTPLPEASVTSWTVGVT